MSAGDFDLAVASDGKAYYYFERVHSETICADLTEDYTDVTGFYSTHFSRPYPPHVREAAAHFVRKNRHYLVTSGTTGYMPNPSEVAVAETWHGPYTVLGNPHPGDTSNTSYHSQISSVLKVQGKKDLYIACADRWLPGQMNQKYEDYARIYEMIFNPEGNKSELARIQQEHPLEAGDNTSIADYVWLPLRFADPDARHPQGMVYIDWMDEWRVEDYE